MGQVAGSRQPTLRQKANGAWFVRWGGKDRYLSTDRRTAERLLLDPDCPHSLIAWRAWADGQTARSRGPQLTVADIAVMLLDDYDARGRSTGYLRKHLRRFLNLFGTMDVVEITTPAVERGQFQAPVITLLIELRSVFEATLAPKTINHDLGAVQRLFAWAAERGISPDVNFARVRKLPTTPGDPQVIQPAGVRALVRAMRHCHPQLAAHWAINYLTLCRPSETVRIVAVADAIRRRDKQPGGAWHDIIAGDGKVVAGGRMLELVEHKTAHHGHRRQIVITDEAQAWLAVARPTWHRLDSYSTVSRRHGVAPSWLRDSAATHLRHLGVPLQDVDELLGHAQKRVTRSYVREAWPVLLASAARLSLR